MKKQLFIGLITSLLLLSGCSSDKGVKVSIQFKCIDNKLYADTYLGVVENNSESVVSKKYLKHKNELVLEDGIKISCENTK